MLDRVESVIEDRIFQPLGDWILQTFDRSIYWVAEKLYAISLVFWLGLLAIVLLDWHRSGWDTVFYGEEVGYRLIFYPLIMVWAGVHIWSCRELEQRKDQRVMSRIVYGLRGSRMFFTLMAVIGIPVTFLLDWLGYPLMGKPVTDYDTYSGIGFVFQMLGIWFHTIDPRPRNFFRQTAFQPSV